MTRALLLSLFVSLTACSTLPKDKAGTNKTNERALIRLEREHNHYNILIVNIRPAKSRKCWSHNRHWHCHR